MRFYLIFIFFLFYYGICDGQETIKNEFIIEKLRIIRSVVQDIKTSDSTTIEKINDIRLLISDINIRLDAFKGEFPKPYLSSVNNLLIRSREIATSSKIDQNNELDYIYDDLSLKFKDRANTLGSQLFNDLLTVSVECSRKGNVVKGLRVRYAPMGYLFRPTKQLGMFSALTSPAKDMLVPGYYWIWVTKDGDLSVLRRWEGEISPEKENNIQLEVP